MRNTSGRGSRPGAKRILPRRKSCGCASALTPRASARLWRSWPAGDTSKSNGSARRARAVRRRRFLSARRRFWGRRGIKVILVTIKSVRHGFFYAQINVAVSSHYSKNQNKVILVIKISLEPENIQRKRVTMFYLKHNGEKLPIEGDNVYT